MNTIIYKWTDGNDKDFHRFYLHKAPVDLDDYENHKDDEGIIAKIIKGQDNLSNAIQNARDLRESYQTQGETIETIIDKYLPYSEVYELVEQLAIAASI